MRLLHLFLLTSALVVSSCTIQKRAFRSGYYISWNKHIPKEKGTSKEEVSEIKTEPLAETILKDTTTCKEEKPESIAVTEKPDTLQENEALASEADTLKVSPLRRYSEEELMKRLTVAVESIKAQRYPATAAGSGGSGGSISGFLGVNAFIFATAFVIFVIASYESNLNWSWKAAIFCFLIALLLEILSVLTWDEFWHILLSVLVLGLLVIGTILFIQHAGSI